MKVVQHDLRGYMVKLNRIIEEEWRIDPEIRLRHEAKIIIEDIVHYVLIELTPGSHAGEGVDTMLLDEHPSFVSRFPDEIDNLALQDLLNDIYDDIHELLPKVTPTWSLRFNGDYMQYMERQERTRNPTTVSEFKRFLRRKERDEGTYVRDTLNLIEQFEANRVT